MFCDLTHNGGCILRCTLLNEKSLERNEIKEMRLVLSDCPESERKFWSKYKVLIYHIADKDKEEGTNPKSEQR